MSDTKKLYTRKELFLAKIADSSVQAPEPVTREEMYLAKRAGMDVTIPEPSSRAEMYMAAAAGADVVLPEPYTREEMFLAKMAGMDIATPEPSSSLEAMLSKAAGGSSGGSGGGGTYEKYSWEGVFASIKAGTYATDYAIGDMIPLDLGSEGLINMQIVAFDTDDLADGSGKAPITWIAKELLVTKHRMNPALVTNADGTYQEGTGAIGGWEKCEMRTYLKETIKPLIPEPVRNSIKEVTKTQDANNTDGSEFTQTSIEDVWLLEFYETKATSGIYKSFFSSTDSRKKSAVGSTAISEWWTRGGYTENKFRYIGKTGTASGGSTNEYKGVCLCFCT